MKRKGPATSSKVDIGDIVQSILECHEQGWGFCLITMRPTEGNLVECDVTFDHPNSRKAALEVLKDDVEMFTGTQTPYLM